MIPTRQAVADATGVELAYQPELWEQIQERFRRFGRTATENNRRQAYIPSNAIPVENPVGTAPAFIVDTSENVLLTLPGVPREMEYLIENDMLPFLQKRFDLRGIILARVFHTAGVGESQVDEWVSDLETLSNPTVGLAAHPGQTDIRITAKADNIQEADEMINNTAKILYQRLGENIYGVDDETLEAKIREMLVLKGYSIVLIHEAFEQRFQERLSECFCSVIGTSASALEVEKIYKELENYCIKNKAEIGVWVTLKAGDKKQTLDCYYLQDQRREHLQRNHGGAAGLSPLWAENTALDFIRRCLLD